MILQNKNWCNNTFKASILYVHCNTKNILGWLLMWCIHKTVNKIDATSCQFGKYVSIYIPMCTVKIKVTECSVILPQKHFVL